jgi:methylase of polypeptide subunit release factors
MSDPTLDAADSALVDLGRLLDEAGYEFTTVTPETHRRNNARHEAAQARSVRDVFGWSRPFARSVLPAAMIDALERSGRLVEDNGLLRATVRFSSLRDHLYAHSAYPTVDEGAVFFGPDTYRFCSLLDAHVKRTDRVVDVCCGSGVGGLSLVDRADRIVLADINPAALRLARVNAEFARAANRTEVVQGDLFAPVAGDVDLIVANPPYLLDSAHRVYRDGGGSVGEGLAVRIVREGLARLASGGTLVLYTGAPVIDGRDQVRAAIAPFLELGSARWTYFEIDPDVFGEELDQPAYAAVERIAVVAAIATVA